jgi:hypothetical protein
MNGYHVLGGLVQVSGHIRAEDLHVVKVGAVVVIERKVHHAVVKLGGIIRALGAKIVHLNVEHKCNDSDDQQSTHVHYCKSERYLVVTIMTSVEKSNHVIHMVSVNAFKIFRGKPHCDDAVSDVGKILSTDNHIALKTLIGIRKVC